MGLERGKKSLFCLFSICGVLYCCVVMCCGVLVLVLTTPDSMTTNKTIAIIDATPKMLSGVNIERSYLKTQCQKEGRILFYLYDKSQQHCLIFLFI